MSKLTQLSKGQSCIRCGAPDAYSCHYNGHRQYMLGKGRGKKCHDLATAEFCHRCDLDFSEGNFNEFVSKIDKSEQFLFFIMLTNIRRLENGVIKE